jgi:hypothetical protein
MKPNRVIMRAPSPPQFEGSGNSQAMISILLAFTQNGNPNSLKEFEALIGIHFKTTPRCNNSTTSTVIQKIAPENMRVLYVSNFYGMLTKLLISNPGSIAVLPLRRHLVVIAAQQYPLYCSRLKKGRDTTTKPMRSLRQYLLHRSNLLTNRSLASTTSCRSHLNRFLIIEASKHIFFKSRVDFLKIRDAHFVHGRACLLRKCNALPGNVMGGSEVNTAADQVIGKIGGNHERAIRGLSASVREVISISGGDLL